jgi:hypothetical protein
MPENAFERFRRLRGLTTQECPPGPVAQGSVSIEDGVLVEDDEPSIEIAAKDCLETLTPLALLRTLHARGIRMAPYPEGKVRCHAPQGAWTPALLEALNTHQAAMADLLEAFEERAAIAEHCGNLARPAAEALAWQYVLGEIPEQAPQMPVPATGQGR